MNDIERLWDDYPTGRPPTDDILRAGRRSESKRRRMAMRPLMVAAGVAALSLAFVGGVLTAQDGMSGDNGSDDAASGPHLGAADVSPVAFQAGLEAPSSCDDLLDSYVTRGLEQVSAWGWSGPISAYAEGRDSMVTEDLAADGAAESTAKGASQVDEQSSSETGTNVQEQGIDEPDAVKTDGSLLVRVRGSSLITYDVTGDQVRELGDVTLRGMQESEILLSGDTVVVLDRRLASTGAATRVVTVDVSDPSVPEVLDTVTYDSGLESARQHGDTIRLVLSAGLPELDFVQPGDNRSEQAALRHNRELVENSTIEDWLPTRDVGDGRENYLDCGAVAIPEDETGLDTVSVVGFDAGDPIELDAVGLAGATSIAYESADHLYLASSSATGWAQPMIDCADCSSIAVPGGSSGTSYLYDFELDGTTATHVASGEVEGVIRDRWSMDEADDVLRVAVGPSSQTGNFNSIVTLKRQGDELEEHGRLDGLGKNEDIKSARWFDDLAILVTFRQVDPFYAVDLTDTARPRQLSELKIDGFSSYLHPVDESTMLGVGSGPTGKGGWGAQVGLFDVSDLTDVTRPAVHRFSPDSYPMAADDPRSFTWLPDQRVALTVIQRGNAGYVASIRPDGGKLAVDMTRVEYGTDAYDVRTIGLPDGRVVLVTGEDVAFFDL